jgi:hypothetical protein
MTRSKYFNSQETAETFLANRGFARFEGKAWESRWGWIQPITGVQADVRYNSKGYFINFGI